MNTNDAATGAVSALTDKLEQLKTTLTGYGSVLVAFSGGVDSTMLAVIAHEVLGDQMRAVTLAFPAVPRMEVFEAIKVARKIGMRHQVIDAPELLECIRHNDVDRCYKCKQAICSLLAKVASEEGLACIVEGSNRDDLSAHRPGAKALKAAGVISPLADAGFTKAEIRQVLHMYDMPNAGKPASTCLATRFPYGTAITVEDLMRIEQAEQEMREMGFGQFRVRAHDHIARIEVGDEDLARFADEALRKRIVQQIKACGFTYVVLDLQGYRTGSMDEPGSICAK